MGKIQSIGAAALIAVCWQAQASVVTFTGGTATMLDASTHVSTNSTTWSPVDFYVEAGFKLDFLPGAAWGYVGDYYGVGNSVIHAHWALGGLGSVATIEITKVGGGTFDLNYFKLTSNTDTGGGAANGTELAYVEGFNSNVSTGAAVLLPSENWGFPASQIFLGSAFDLVDKVVFYTTTDVDCFGMDEFFIDEAAPGVPGGGGAVPEAASLVVWSLMGGVGIGIVWYRRRNLELVV